MNRKAILGVLVLAALAGVVAMERTGATAPITPRPLLTLVADTERQLERLPLELTRVSTEQENEIGQELARQYGYLYRSPQEGDSREIAATISRIGDRIATHARRKGIRYRFHYLDESSCVNAWAMPGGQIVVGRGMVELMETEDELAAVIGHEIAHVDERHAIERLQYELKSRRLGLRGLYRLGRPAIAIFEAGYTKEKEAEADRAGLALTVAAGYSPGGALSLMQRFQRFQGLSRQPASAVGEMLTVPLRSLQEYFRTHPPFPERIATLEKEIAAKGWDASQAQQPLKLRAIFVAEAAARLDRSGAFENAVARYRQALEINPDYLNARIGLANAAWRAGDAPATAAAAEDVVRRMPNAARMWKLLAEALSATEGGRERIYSRYDSLFREISQRPESRMNAETIFAVQIDRFGLEVQAGKLGAAESFWRNAAGRLNARTEALARTRLAWWMYRVGQYGAAQRELGLAVQRFPGEMETKRLFAWVLSDLGRQKDATDVGCCGETPEDYAQTAVVLWRTDQRKEAEQMFARAPAADPVWMQRAWVENSFSSATARILVELQAGEIARRQREADERAGRIPPGGRRTLR